VFPELGAGKARVLEALEGRGVFGGT